MSHLPVPAEEAPSDTYIRVHPTTDPLAVDGLAAPLRRLYSLARTAPDGLRDRLLGGPEPATIECLLASEGPDTPLTYLFGIDDPDRLDALERVLRTLVPNTYELTRTGERPPGLDRATDQPAVAGVEYLGCVERPADWQTQLTPFATFGPDTDARVPLAALAACMADTDDATIVYQCLLRPKPDWTATATATSQAIATGADTIGGQLTNAVVGPPTDDVDLSDPDVKRQAELAARDTRCSFECTLRAAVLGADEATVTHSARELADLFEPVGHTGYTIEGRVTTGAEGRQILTDIRNRLIESPRFERLTARLTPGRTQSQGLVADAAEVASFWLLDGATLTPAASRLVAPTPGERTNLPRPPVDQLARYRGAGMPLGRPLTQDGTPDADPLVLPPELQPLHVGWFGKTGSGKSTSLISGILANHAATDGADILIDPKGDGMATDYLRAHYATYGTLEDVIYFDCARALPAFGFFDIRDELAAGVPRTTAVEDAVDHYLEILTQIMGRDRFAQAVRSPDIIRYLTKAMFDPVSGYEAFAHRDLHTAVRTMHERQAAPAVSDPDLERMLAGVVANRARSFDEIMQGVANRMEKIPVDQRLARIFNHVPDEGDPHFDLAAYLSEDVVIIFETGDLRSEAQRVLTLVVLSNLWTALRRRTRRSDAPTQPLVNLYVEEAASIAVSDLLKQLLAQSRAFDCSVTLAMQFPAQLREHSEGAYDEVLNNISTFVTGNVPVDGRLADRLATDEMPPQAVSNRLRALRRGQWLVNLPAAFAAPEPRPFLVQSLAPPPGDPAGPHQFIPSEARAFEEALAGVHDRTVAEAGLTLGAPSPVSDEDEATTDADADADEELARPQVRVDSALPHTKRLPPTVRYVPALHALQCTECDNRYDPDIEGMRRAIACCSALEAVDSDDIPICELHLKLTADERATSEWSDRQLMFLQAVYNAQQLRYDPLEYDLLWDSMIRLQEYVGIDPAAVQDLIDADLLRHETDRPHRLYTVSPEGRAVIGESYRQGVDYGHGAGDLEESTEHVLGVEVARQYLISTYRDDPESDVTEVIPYYDLGGNQRLDLAGVDPDGTVIVAVEIERVNHDLKRAVPEDFDKMAACDSDEAIWIVMSHTEGHEVLAALTDPLDGEARVAKTYAETTPVSSFTIDTPGLTAMYTVEQIRDALDNTE